MGDWTGGCMCGKVRFRLESEPFDAGWCHCRTCQLTSGAPAVVFASVREGDYIFTAGEEAVGRARSSGLGHRAFCSECGTPLYMKDDDQPKTVDFSSATLDEPGRLRPGFHIFWSSRLPWMAAADDLPKFDRTRS